MASKIKGERKKGSKKDGVGGGLVCAHCKKEGELNTMKRCSRCRRACYCSVECQKLHWKSGGHKNVCGKEGGSGTSHNGAGASGGVDAPLQHPCPICLDNEDDAGEQPGMCCSCGQMFCGSCKTSIDEHGVMNCPTCRAALDISETERVRQLHQLLARPEGRHTRGTQFDLGICFEQGVAVVQDSSEAARRWRLAADQGHAAAQYNLGASYQVGAGVPQDSAEAARWFHLAADQGYVKAQFNLGGYYEHGTGVPQDSAEAARWYRLAADQGFARAQSNLGLCYFHGAGVTQDAAEAVRWFHLAADQEHAPAQFNLGASYQNGDGVPQDSAEAARWFRLAADQGYSLALAAVAQLGL